MKHANTWPATCFAVIVLLSLFSFRDSARAAENGDKVKPGEFIIDHPTLINLGFEWLIQGDDNRNARVEVSYRKQGETPWKQGCRCCVCKANEFTRTRACLTSSLPTCLPAAFWIWSLIPRMRLDL